PVIGRNFTDEEDAPKATPVALISERLWRRRFGGQRDVLGKKLVVAGNLTEIIGVMPDGFRFPNPTTDLWLPVQLDPNDPYPGGFNYNSFARLRPGLSVDAAQRDFASVLPRAVEV